jgi:hypothetical protein
MSLVYILRNEACEGVSWYSVCDDDARTGWVLDGDDGRVDGLVVLVVTIS